MPLAVSIVLETNCDNERDLEYRTTFDDKMWKLLVALREYPDIICQITSS